MLDKKYAMLYAATSANLLNFFGNDSFDKHLEIFNKTTDFSAKAHRDLMEFGTERLEILDPSDVLSTVHGTSPIFVTFHTGSFNMLISLMMRRCKDVMILADTGSVQKDDYHLAIKAHAERYKSGNTTTLVNVEENGAIFQLIRRIRQGAVPIAFIDGNKGVDGLSKVNENLLDVPFFRGVVRVRKGLAYIAYLTKRPIVLVLHYCENNEDYIRVHEPIWSECTDKEDFCREVISRIYRYFSAHVKDYPEQWCNLPYFHRWADLTVFQRPVHADLYVPAALDFKKWHFNNRRFCPIIIEGSHYLFDRFNYSVLPVSPEMIDLFSKKTSGERKTALFETCCRDHQGLAKDYLAREVFTEA